MPHKLLIAVKLKPPRQYKRLLSENETVNKGKTRHIFTVKNIGDKLFPGGSIILEAERPTGIGSVSGTTPTIKIGPLEPKKKFTLEVVQRPELPGVWVLTFKVKPKDKKQVEYYKSEDGAADKEEWTHFYYVVDYHQIDIKRILKKLEEKKM